MIENSKLSSRFIKKEKELAENSPTERETPENITEVAVKDEELVIVEETQIEPQVIVEEVPIEILKTNLLNKIETTPVWNEFSEEKQKEMIRTFIKNKVSSDFDIESFCQEIFANSKGFGPLQKLIDNEKISTVYFNSSNPVFIEIDGKILNTEIKLSPTEFNLIKNHLLEGRKFEQSSFSFRKENFFISVVQNTNFVIKKAFSDNIYSLIEKEFITKDQFDFIVSAIREQKNIVICGSVNSGKSTLLDVILNTINVRSALIEKSNEISDKSDLLLRFIDNEPDLVENVIKLTPDYIFSDTNSIITQLTNYQGALMTLRSPSVESAMKSLVAYHMVYENIPEKFARTKVLKYIDYLVFVAEGSVKTIIELTPAKTAAASMRVVM